jgi:hypothetical protein
MAQAFYPTAANVIAAAIRAIAAADPEGGLSPSTTENTNALQALNFLVTSWAAIGMQAWCHKNTSHILTAATNSYTIGPGANIDVARPTSIVQAWLRSTDTLPVDTPVRIISRQEYNLMTVKTTAGPPNALFYDPQYDLPGSNDGANAYGKIFVWPTPSATEVTNYDLHLVYVRPIQDFSATTDVLDFPPEWGNAIKWNLAYQIAFEYGVPVEILDRLEKRAKDELELAESFDTEQTSAYFQPDSR